ncbi:hypothetical protein SNE40_006008 [Patella caerulea]|uniref:Uncharacterized protein n=1 Tax=Patella caerulea TaxID=87958 RepID=A0AAN8K744_PATCE
MNNTAVKNCIKTGETSRTTRSGTKETIYTAEDSTTDISGIYEILKTIKDEMTNTIKKSDIDKISESILDKIRKEMKNEVKHVVMGATSELNEKYENATLKIEQLTAEKSALQKQVEDLDTDLNKENKRINESINMANYNEQYSRKMNIRVFGLPTQESQDLKETFIEHIKRIANVGIAREEIIALHKLPTKYPDRPTPVLVKMINTETKSKIMKCKTTFLLNNIKLADDITKRNLSLMNRAYNHQRVDQVWFFNGCVYAKSTGRKKIRIGLFDDLDEKMLSAPLEEIHDDQEN